MLPANEPWVTPAFRMPDEPYEPLPPCKPRSNFKVSFNEDDPIALMVDDDPIMIYIESCDSDSDIEPYWININTIVEKWIEYTGRIPLTIAYGDYTYEVKTGEFTETRQQWRPERGQEDWTFDGVLFHHQ